MSVVALLTDFGTDDAYVGIMHGVILRVNPEASIVDVCHDIAPQDVQAAAFVLSTAYPYFPTETIYVVVVDPGVGSERRAIAMRTRRGTFVAPDNGVLSYVLAREAVSQMVQVTNARYWLSPLSDTFHGRDVFAPVAAHLSLGLSLSELGPPVRDPVHLTLAEPRVGEDGTIRGQVLHVDRFGNLVTNIRRELLSPGQTLRTRVADREVPGLVKTYAAAGWGELLTLVGSNGYLEISLRDGSAATALKVGRGAEVVLVPVEDLDQPRIDRLRR
ncbi:MAG TPA: SAM-dependent chlorinase/fluorinase [Anaerolineae bacterium]|nr:SAM-dependent chlorinase/fluorinase [Anaerolineae bacterium]